MFILNAFKGDVKGHIVTRLGLANGQARNKNKCDVTVHPGLQLCSKRAVDVRKSRYKVAYRAVDAWYVFFIVHEAKYR